MNICPGIGEHALIVGKTGSGKTTTFTQLAVAIRQSFPLFIVDTKGDSTLEGVPGAVVLTKPSQIQLTGVEIYRPEGELNTEPLLDAVLHSVFLAGKSMYVYIDELSQVSGQQRPGQGLANLVQRGRDRTV